MQIAEIKKYIENCKNYPHSKRMFEEAFEYFTENIQLAREDLSTIYKIIIEEKITMFEKELNVTLRNKEKFTTEKIEMHQKRFIKKLPPLIEFTSTSKILQEIWKAKEFEPYFLTYRKIIHHSIQNSKKNDSIETVRFDFIRDNTISSEDSLE